MAPQTCVAPRPAAARCPTRIRLTTPQDSEPVTAVALDPHGRLLFAASRSLQLRSWLLGDGQPARSFKGHRAPVADIVVHASGSMLATGSADRMVRVWDADGGYCTHAFAGHR